MAGLRELGLAAAAAALLMACSVMADDSAPAPQDHGGQVQPAASDALTLAAIESAVRADAGQAWQGVDPASLQLAREAVTWSDSALGCPRPGMTYAQVLVPGWRLAVHGGGRERIYHASRRGRWLWCPGANARPAVPGGPATR